ncbi:putative spermidine/putrescine transport system substrate-binding protein [Rhizobium pisi]|uniref:Extracellular solute-binding protein n=1 Tax=Rhizobium pisi TaxID=574561 RepID=A0A427MXM7_9HYPH|nr:extracellular solute-binding protein [Rhizobium pisi]MBB3135884.1 putative spermidine/putrescine transport system substrate-binding protein [Rhizobium pisi]RSB75908.1 extracellular solute-binding protein [Rhizobium pisi]TCA49397.1 extracellular solute-binding protein [Rhizobium pisi]
MPIESTSNTSVRRRSMLKGLSGLALAPIVSGFPSIARAQEKKLRVGLYGGYFKDTFDAEIFPDFTAATGIAVESVGEPTGEVWLIQLEQAAKAGKSPVDISMMAGVPVIRGSNSGLWAPLDPKKIPNIKYIKPELVRENANGEIVAIGATSWYVTLVSNTDVYPEAPKSWKDIWDPKYKDSLGLLANVGNSYLLEVTAKVYFGGIKHLDTDDGIREVAAKVGELKPNVRLWYRDEAQFEQALKSGEIPMGQYFHDVTRLAVRDGFHVRSTMPIEGGIYDYGTWAVTKAAASSLDLAYVYMDYMSQPSTQAKLARKLGCAPVVERSTMDLTDEEFDSVSSDIDPIRPHYEMQALKTEFINQVWTEMQQG